MEELILSLSRKIRKEEVKTRRVLYFKFPWQSCQGLIERYKTSKSLNINQKYLHVLKHAVFIAANLVSANEDYTITKHHHDA